MKKSILFLLGCIMSVALYAQSNITKVATTVHMDESISVTSIKAPAAAPQRIDQTHAVTLKYVPTSLYEAMSPDMANYYFVATSAVSQYDSTTGTLAMPNGCYALMVDFYNTPSDPIQLEPGVYKPSYDNEPFTYDPTMTAFQYMTGLGELINYEVKGDIVVEFDESTLQYTVTLQEPIFDKTVGMFNYYMKVSYTGDMGFRGSNVQNQFYPAIAHNINQTFSGALGVYRGDEMESSTGCMWLYVYTSEFDPASGAMLEPGLEIRMFLFNRLFGDPSKAEVLPGVYTVARNFKRNTFFPGMEINFMGYTVPYGSMAVEITGNDATDKVGYINDGTYTIERDETTGEYTLTLDLRTTLGYKVQGTYTGPIGVVDMHVEKQKVVLSTLEEDLEMNLSRVKTMNVSRNIFTADKYAGTTYVSASTTYISDAANAMGLTHYVVDLGYDGSTEIIGYTDDGKAIYGTEGGDLMRLEFFADADEKIFPDGTYTLMETTPSYNTGYYAAGLALQGYFLPGGEMSGTRWAHNAPNPYADRYWHWDGHAPAVDGKFVITHDADGTYHVSIDVIDDGGFAITGEWEGALRCNWDIEAEGIGTVLAPGVGESDACIYDLQGRKVAAPHEGVSIVGGRKVIK